MPRQLMAFLRSGIDRNETTHAWLTRFCRELIAPWQEIARNTHKEWEVCSELVVRTDPALGRDMPLNVFSGRIDGSGRVTLNTLHSAKAASLIRPSCLVSTQKIFQIGAMLSRRGLYEKLGGSSM